MGQTVSPHPDPDSLVTLSKHTIQHLCVSQLSAGIYNAPSLSEGLRYRAIQLLVFDQQRTLPKTDMLASSVLNEIETKINAICVWYVYLFCCGVFVKHE